jgi:hypothetical protein
MTTSKRPEKARTASDPQAATGNGTPGKGKGRILLWLLLFLALGSGLFLFGLVLEGKPRILESSLPTVDSARRARDLAKQVLACLNGQADSSITASEKDLNALLTLVARGDRRFSGRVRITPQSMTLAVSIRLTAGPLGRYLNLSVELLPDQRGLNFERVKVGKLRVPRRAALALLRGIINLGLGNREGTALLGSVRSVGMQGDRVTLDLRSLPQLKERLKRLQALLVRLREVGQVSPSPWDRAAVAIYYQRLLEVTASLQQSPGRTLADYLGPLFRLARSRSAAGDPARENRSALMALVIYLGDPRFDKLAGTALGPELTGRSQYNRPVSLGGRQDLRLHFVISAGLKLISDQGISSAIGEFKELLDAGRGGSGFSFVDLAADRAGIRFAERAGDPDGGAARLQKMLSASPTEQLFFPGVADLPENLSSQDFESRYGGIGKTGYDKMIGEIDRRIASCPLHRK